MRHHVDERGNRPRRHHPHPPGAGPVHDERFARGRGRRGRAARGDTRAAVLMLLADGPQHGYQLMQSIAERSGGRWRPSPGAIYPSIAQLEDEGLVTVTKDAGRKLVALTDAGRDHIAAHQDSGPDPFVGFADAGTRVDLRGLIEQLHGAVREVARTGSDHQVAATADILAKARRSIYQLLAEEPTPADD